MGCEKEGTPYQIEGCEGGEEENMNAYAVELQLPTIHGNPVDINKFRETKAAYRRRFQYAKQAGDYPHRPGDNGYFTKYFCEPSTLR